MVIKKVRMMPGWYAAEGSVDGELFCAIGESLSEALDRVFKKIYWAFDLEIKN